MQSTNVIILACAGSGKTWGICNDSINSDKVFKKSLMVSYTNKGVYSLKKEFAKQNQGILNSNVKICTWFQFLLREFIKPYQKSFLNAICQIRTCDFSEMYGVDYSRKNTKSYFLNTRNDVKANNASEFALLINELSNGAVIKRIEEAYSCIYIDELQDLVGKDIELLELLFLSSIKIYCVGDYKQATFKTHNPKSDKKKGGMYVFDYLETIKASHNLEIIKNNISKRFIKEIAEFANLFYAQDYITSDVDANENAMGVFQIHMNDLHRYINYFHPEILKYDIKTFTFQYSSLNFGASKGMTFERVLIFPNGPLRKFLSNPDDRLKAPDKYFVGVTRAKYSVVFVSDKLIPNNYFSKDKIFVNGEEIDVLRFIS